MRCELIAMVDETDIGNVAVDNPVNFTVEAYPTTEFEGRVAAGRAQGHDHFGRRELRGDDPHRLAGVNC